MSISIRLDGWGLIECLNEQHKEYLIAAKQLSTISQSVNSWQCNGWLSDSMRDKYMSRQQETRKECERLWELIPDKTDDLSKSH